MTFDEWLEDKHLGSMELQFAKDAWEKSAAAQRERCAKVCSAIAEKYYDHAKPPFMQAVNAIEQIRKHLPEDEGEQE